MYCIGALTCGQASFRHPLTSRGCTIWGRLTIAGNKPYIKMAFVFCNNKACKHASQRCFHEFYSDINEPLLVAAALMPLRADKSTGPVRWLSGDSANQSVNLRRVQRTALLRVVNKQLCKISYQLPQRGRCVLPRHVDSFRDLPYSPTILVYFN